VNVFSQEQQNLGHLYLSVSDAINQFWHNNECSLSLISPFSTYHLQQTSMGSPYHLFLTLTLNLIHYYWWTASIKPRLLFSHAGYASWGLSLSSVYYYYSHLRISLLIILQISQNYLTFYRWCLSACVVPLRSYPIANHCVPIFFWSSGIMD